MSASRWLPRGFAHPLHVDLTEAVRLRPIRASDVDIDMVTVTANQPMLWRMYGEAWGWPPTTMTREQDEDDLARHAAEMQTQESFNYAVLDAGETRLLGCVYIDPLPEAPEQPAAEVSWWVGDEVEPAIRRELDAFVPRWLAQAWPFATVETPFQHLR